MVSKCLMVSSKASSDVYYSHSSHIGTKQNTPYDFIDQVFGDLGYGYEEELLPDDDYNHEEHQEENQEEDEEENQEEELNIPQGNVQFFPHFQQEADNENMHPGNYGEDSKGFDDTPPHGKWKQVEKRGSGRRVKACTNNKVSLFHSHSSSTYIFAKIVVSLLPKDVQSTHDIAARSGKVKLGDFTDWLTVKLAKAGHRAMRHYVATIEAFPLPIDKEELSWTCLVKAAEGNDEMIANLEVLEKTPCCKAIS